MRVVRVTCDFVYLLFLFINPRRCANCLLGERAEREKERERERERGRERLSSYRQKEREIAFFEREVVLELSKEGGREREGER